MTIYQICKSLLLLVSSILILFAAQTVQAQDDDVETPDYTIDAVWGQDGDVQFQGPNGVAIDVDDNVYTYPFRR